jgi:hypothetical protein
MLAHSILGFGSTGRLQIRNGGVSMSNNGTFSPAGNQIIRVTSLNGSDRFLQSSGTFYQDDLKFVVNEDGTNTIFLLNADTSAICNVGPHITAMIVCDGANWHPIMLVTNGT